MILWYLYLYLYLYLLDTHIVYHSISFSVIKNTLPTRTGFLWIEADKDWQCLPGYRSPAQAHGVRKSAFLMGKLWKITMFNGKTWENHGKSRFLMANDEEIHGILVGGDWNHGILWLSHHIVNNLPNWLIFFRGVGQPPTSRNPWEKWDVYHLEME